MENGRNWVVPPDDLSPGVRFPMEDPRTGSAPGLIKMPGSPKPGHQ